MAERKVYKWIDERAEVEGVVDLMRKKTVPIHKHTLWYYLGGMTLFFFVVQFATGVLLMLYYKPSEAEAFSSVQFIVTRVPFGWLIRSIHSWSANLMIAAAFVHLFSVFFLKAYRRPREITWYSGAIMLFLALGFGFSGYLLPWNQLAYFATKVGTDIAGSVPLVGDWLLRFLRGGDHVTGGTLSRFYGWHVAILPILFTSMLVIHLVMVQKQGMSMPLYIGRKKLKPPSMPFFPNFALRDLAGWIVAVILLGTLAAFFPWELGEEADPFAPAFKDIKPEWYFMFMFQTLKYVPGGEIFGIEYEAFPIMAFGLAFLLLFLVPFLDRKVESRGGSPVFTVIGWLALVYILVMTGLGYHTWWVAPAGLLLMAALVWLSHRMGSGLESEDRR